MRRIHGIVAVWVGHRPVLARVLSIGVEQWMTGGGIRISVFTIVGIGSPGLVGKPEMVENPQDDICFLDGRKDTQGAVAARAT